MDSSDYDGQIVFTGGPGPLSSDIVGGTDNHARWKSEEADRLEKMDGIMENGEWWWMRVDGKSGLLIMEALNKLSRKGIVFKKIAS